MCVYVCVCVCDGKFLILENHEEGKYTHPPRPYFLPSEIGSKRVEKRCLTYNQ